jgi:hypothetical protein
MKIEQTPMRSRVISTFLLLTTMAAAAALLDASPVSACSAADSPACATRLSRLFHRRLYGPDIFLGEDLRLTIHSATESPPAPDDKTAAAPQALDTVRAMFDALRSCWVPPAQDKARPGMEMTVRFALKRDGEMIAPPRVTYATHGVSPETRDIYFNAIMAALQRCTPLPLTGGLASEITGVPIAIRFVDDRQTQG